MISKARSLELFFIDGRPDGMLTAEVFNWTGHVLRLPRTQIKEGLDRPETRNTGVYVLIGEKDEGPLAYIGEAETLGTRLAQHVSGKDWWDTAILISTTGDLLHKAHVKYLESRLVEIAREVGSMPLENNTTPARNSLTEAAQANMESFLDTLDMVLPAIRVDMFLRKTRRHVQPAVRKNDSTYRFVLRLPKSNIEAFAVLENGEWIVQAGSSARTSWVGTDKYKSYRNLHQELLDTGTLRIEGEHAVFTENYAFSSPSAAGAVISGRATNGRTAWSDAATGKTFADWEEARIAETAT
jgi:hypothetical protein